LKTTKQGTLEDLLKVPDMPKRTTPKRKRGVFGFKKLKEAKQNKARSPKNKRKTASTQSLPTTTSSQTKKKRSNFNRKKFLRVGAIAATN
jgi:hypothetical protein